MNGLAALQQTNPMAQANNPRTAAAMEVVSNEGLENLLPPATEALLNLQEATNLIASADGLLAQAGRPTTATVVEQRQQQSLDGIAAALARTQQSTPPRRPMMAQQRPPMMGQQRQPMRPPMMGQQPMRPPMQGMAGMPAPNMMRAAQGGIVGYAEGGKAKQQDAPFLSPSSEEAQRQRYLKLKEIEAKFLAEGNQEGLRNIRRELMNYEGSTAAQAPAPTPENTAGMVGGGIVGYAKGGAMYDEMGRQSTNKNMNEMFETLTSQNPTGPMNPLSKEFAERIRLLEREIDLITRPRRKAKMMDIPTKGNVFPTDAPPELLNELNLLKEARAKALAANDMAGGGIVSFVKGGETGFPDLNKDGKVTYADVIKGRIGKKEGGIIGYAEGDLVNDPFIQARADAYFLANPPPERPTYVSSEQRRENLKAKEAERVARLESEERVRQQRRALRSQGVPISALEEIINAKPSVTEFLPGNPENLPMGGTAQLTGNGTPPPPPVITPPPSSEKTDVVEDIVERISEINVEPGTSDLTGIVSEYAKGALGRDRATEEAQRRQDALDFYGMSDRERLLRQQAADAQAKALSAELDPEILRQQKIESALERLSGPGGIIGAGRRGAAARPAFDKQVRDLKRQRELAPIAAELETLGMDRAAREKAFAAGTELAKTFSAEMNTALQSLANLSNVEMSAKTSAAIQNARTSITALTTQASNELAQLREKGLNIRDNKEYKRRVDESIAKIKVDISKAISEVNADITMDDATKQSSIQDLNAAYNVARNQILGSGSGGGNLTPEQQAADAILGI